MKRITTLFLTCLVTVLETMGQTTYSLDDCLRLALANNTKLQTASLNVGQATEQRRESFTNYFPTVSASGLGFMANRGLVDINIAGMGMSMLKNGVSAGVTVMQPVFAGGQIVNGNKLAKVGETASKLQMGLTENEVRLTTETYYWQIVMLKEKLHTIDRVETQIENARKDAEAAVEAGVRNRNDLLQVQLRKNEMRATRIQLDNALSLSQRLLAQQMGMADEQIDVSCTIGDDLPESPEHLFTQPSEQLAQTKEYQLLGMQVEAEHLNYKMSVGKNLPTVAVGGGYFYNDFMDKSSNRLVGMVTVSVPISGWWGGSHAMKRQQLKWKSAENDRRDQGEMLVIRMRKAWNDLSDAYKQLGIAQESIAQSEENLRLNTDYYQAGTASISDLLDAQTLFQQSHDRYVEAYTQYEIKKREYLQSTGR